MYVTMFSISLLIKNIIIRIQCVFDSVKHTQNKMFQSVKNHKETWCFTLSKIQGNKVFQSAEKCEETRCFNLPKNTLFQTLKRDVSNLEKKIETQMKIPITNEKLQRKKLHGSRFLRIRLMQIAFLMMR